MQMRGLFVAVALLAALSGGIWWTTRTPKIDDTTAVPDSKSTKLMSLLEADLVEVKISRRNEEPLLLQKDAATQRWRLVSQQAKEPGFPTDYDGAQTLVNSSSVFPSDKLVDENASDLIQYGLDPPQVVVEVKSKGGKTDRVHLGDDAPVGSQVYAAKPGSRKVYTVAKYLRDGVTKSVNDLRDKRLLLVDEGKVTRIEVVRKGESFEFGRNGKNEWQIVKPQPMRADNLAVEELFRKAKEAKYEAVPTPEQAKKDLAAFGSAAAVATLRVTDAKGTQLLEVRKAKDNSYYARAAAGVFKVQEELGGGLDKALEEFRNKKLFEFGLDEPQRIEVKNNGKATLLEKKGEDWLLAGKKMDPATVQPFLDQVRLMQALGFVSGKATAPFLEIAVTQKDGKTVERVAVSRTGNFHYAKREGDSSEYELDPKAVSDFESALTAVKPPGAGKK